MKMKPLNSPVRIPVLIFWLLLLIIPTACNPVDPGALEAPAVTAAPTLLAPYVETAQVAELDSRSTLTAGESSLSLLVFNATENAMAAQATQTSVAMQIHSAELTQSALADQTQTAATATSVSLDQSLSATAAVLVMQSTQSAATAQSAQTATQSHLMIAAVDATQSAIQSQTNETEMRDTMNGIVIPFFILLGLAISGGAAYLGYIFFNQVIPAAVLRMRTFPAQDGTTILIMDPDINSTIVDPARMLAPAININEDGATLDALPDDPDKFTIQERTTMRAQLPRVLDAMPSSMRSVDAITQDTFAPSIPNIEILPENFAQQLLAQAESALIIDAEYRPSKD